MACRVIDEITSGKKEHAMTEKNVSAAIVVLKEMLWGDEDFVREAVRTYLQEVLEQEMTVAVGAAKGATPEPTFPTVPGWSIAK